MKNIFKLVKKLNFTKHKYNKYNKYNNYKKYNFMKNG